MAGLVRLHPANILAAAEAPFTQEQATEIEALRGADPQKDEGRVLRYVLDGQRGLRERT